MFIKTIIAILLAAFTSLVNGLPIHIQTNQTSVESLWMNSFDSTLTWYHPALGACGQTHGDGDMVVGVDQTTYGSQANPNTSPVCGKQIRVNYSGRSIVLTVVDKCMKCPLYGLDLSRGAWIQLVGSTDLGPQQGTWDWI